eukprot:scaffold3504_cov240-Pinguiococcus_pyrenoidosus.AAC.58
MPILQPVIPQLRRPKSRKSAAKGRSAPKRPKFNGTPYSCMELGSENIESCRASNRRKPRSRKSSRGTCENFIPPDRPPSSVLVCPQRASAAEPESPSKCVKSEVPLAMLLSVVAALHKVSTQGRTRKAGARK